MSADVSSTLCSLFAKRASRARVSRCGLGLGATQDGPVHVRAQFLAAYGAIGGAFYLGAAFGGDRTEAADPLVDSGWRDVQMLGQRSDAANGINGFFDWMYCVHAAKISLANHEMQ